MKILAIYLRLSEDDGNGGESNSITNQRLLLHDHIRNIPELAGMEIREYRDDGYSGMTIKRPAFTELIDDMKRDMVGCIAVKDFSRFARDYVVMGDYLDHILPFYGIRFIAVGDGYDSENHKGTTADIGTAFKTLRNSIYSADLSVKMKTVIRSRCNNGEYMNGRPPLGYEKVPGGKNLIRANDKAAAIIRNIFKLAADGLTDAEVARRLNGNGIPTAHELAGRRTGAALWSSVQVRNILKNRVYLGEHVYNKSEMVSPGSNMRRNKPESEWITVRDHHEAIIPESLFDKAQRKKERKKCDVRSGVQGHPLRGRVRCGGCGYAMWYSTGHGGQYTCRTRLMKSGGDCCRPVRVDALESTILAMLRMELVKQADLGEISRAVRESLKSRLALLDDKVRDVRNSIWKLENGAMLAYESYAGGEMDAGEYKRLAAESGQEVRKLEEIIVKYQDDIRATEYAYSREGESMRGIPGCSVIDGLSRGVVEDFIDKIIVHGNGAIEIVWAFRRSC